MIELTDWLKSLQQTPAALERMLQQIPPEALKVRNLDEFSAVENLCHLRDIEIEGYGERIKRVLQEDQPSLPDLDGARLAIDRDYNSQEADAALDAFRSARERNVEILRGLTTAQLSREGTLENVGVVTIAKIIDLMIEHDQGHISELTMIANRHKVTSGSAGV